LEILGGFVNGIFLLCIAVFVGLQAVPLFIHLEGASQRRVSPLRLAGVMIFGVVCALVGGQV
jgi:Co/Zn/Cd efflux system component